MGSIITLSIVQSALELGFIYALVALALFISFSILNIADLSTDGCFTLGCAVCASVTLAGHPVLGLLAAMAAGVCSGFVTAFLQTRLGIQSILAGIIVNTGLYTIFNSLNFWIVNGNDVAELILTCREFAKYPLHVFPMMIRTFFTYMIPFGFMGYYPVAFLTGKTGSWVIWAMPLAAFGVVCVASVIWRAGLSGYNSTGT